MAPAARRFAEHYCEALRAYLDAPDEAQRSRAYVLGRRALADGLGVLDMAAAHGEALERLCTLDAASGAGCTRLRRACEFLAECLAPFEMTHRGARDGVRAWRRLNETLENEVKRIAHHLHDEAGQLLASVHLALANVAGRVPPDARASLEEVKTLLRRAEAEVRDLSHELRPLVLDRLGLLPALSLLARNAMRRAGIRVTVSGDESERLAPVVEFTLYRIVQEALANVVRHAHACSVKIVLRVDHDKLRCTVRDDGVGGAAERFDGSEGLGLVGIRERLGALGGSLRVQSRPKRGTTLQIEIPRSS
jgi:signal transduction histidine kinase